jgi:hypothetical protein
MVVPVEIEGRRGHLAHECTRSRVRRFTVAVPAIVLTAGALASSLDLRFGLLAAAVVLGWSQLVGL